MPTVHNEIRRLTELQRAAKIIFALDSGSGGLERLSESIQPVKDLWAYPEDSWLRGESRCISSAKQAAVAGQYAALDLSMMRTGWMMVVEKCELVIGTTGYVNATSHYATLANTATQFRVLDNRGGGPIASLSYEALVAGTGLDFASIYLTANTPKMVTLNYVVIGYGAAPPGMRGVGFQCQAANVDLQGTFYWRERPMLPGEWYQ